jgi:hypothetical protein
VRRAELKEMTDKLCNGIARMIPKDERCEKLTFNSADETEVVTVNQSAFCPNAQKTDEIAVRNFVRF